MRFNHALPTTTYSYNGASNLNGNCTFLIYFVINHRFAADIMRRTMAAYHYAIRRIKRDDQDIVKERFAEEFLNDNNRDFWSETNRKRGKTTVSSNVVDGRCTAESIADFFASKYKDLYSSVAYDAHEMLDVHTEVDRWTSVSGFNSNCIVTSDDVAGCVKNIPVWEERWAWGSLF